MSFKISTKMHNENIPKPEITFASTNIFRQNFEYPNPMINYLKTIPTTMTPKLYINLLQSCKHFYSKKDLLVPLDDCDRYFAWKIILTKRDPLNYKLSFKCWLSRSFYVATDYHDMYFLKNAIRCNLNEVKLHDQNITFNEFQFLIESGVERFECCFTTIKYCSGTVVPVEIILAHLKNVKDILYVFNKETAKLVTTETAEKLTRIIDTSKLETFYFRRIPPIFDFKIFNEFTKVHEEICFDIRKVNDLYFLP